MDDRQYTIGFANLDEKNPFAIRLHTGLEKAAAQFSNIDLIVRDNDLNFQKAKDNIDEFLNLPVDLAMIYHIDEREGSSLVGPLSRNNIPVISVIHAIPFTTYFGMDNVQAGKIVGEELGKWVETHWGGTVDKVLALTNQRVVESVVQRIRNTLETLEVHTGFSAGNVFYLDDGGLPEITRERVTEILGHWQDVNRIVMIALGDHIAVAALEAARAAGREEDIIIGGMDGIQVAEAEFHNPDSRLMYSLSFDAELFGEQLLDLAMRMLQKERVPRQQLMPPARVARQ